MINISNLNKAFDNFTALNGLNLQVKKGSIYGLVGVNGAGKTTIIKHLGGLYRQDAGKVEIDGQPVYDNEDIKKRVGYIPDDLYFFQNYTIKSLAVFYRNLYKNWNEERYRTLTKLLQLDEKRKLNRLSKGMQKQAAFIFTMSIMPDVLLLDEPIDGLDPVVRKTVLQQLIEDVAERSLTVLISSHNLKEMEGICDAIGIVKNGRMLIERDLDDLKTDVHKVQVVFQPDEADSFPNRNQNNLRVLHTEKRGSVTLMVVRGSEAAVIDSLKQMKPLVYDLLPLTLEEIFVYETEGEFDETLN